MPPRHLLLCLPLLLAACAGAGDKFGSPAVPAGGVGTASAAVTAFMHLCGRLEPEEVERRARTYGFVAIHPSRLPSGAPLPAGSRIMARPQGAPALLFWSDVGPGCELAVGGVDPEALATEFDTMLRGLGQRPELAVNTNLPLPPDPGGELRVQRVALVSPRALLPSPPRLMALRTANAPRTIQAVLTLRVMTPGATAAAPPGMLATPPPSLGAPKG
ncbi:hypothetical protein JYK14_14175 [Siccirubricoccus sp. KC 17139]|uniref:Uncharacterized protein n=1 Tax=Siccirubricoccus soli TaxID=2899147 RepID=A0ABT1D603_9PROT|nr:hypothetical protein [Siccirubricoccus soli]MCO6417304.1 hypothetical protein [Siccirubricoccus soli]MCP2683439.1 hypothetical protein [Siccirubricoccus soli]